jgi:hypothetical protein
MKMRVKVKKKAMKRKGRMGVQKKRRRKKFVIKRC